MKRARPLPMTAVALTALLLLLATLIWGWAAFLASVLAGAVLLWRRPGLRARVWETARVIAGWAAEVAATPVTGPQPRPAQPRAARPVPAQPTPAAALNVPVAATNAPAASAAEAPVAVKTDEVGGIQAALQRVLHQFNVDAHVARHLRGPAVTRYEITIGPGVKVEAIARLSANFAYETACAQIRVVAPIPGRSAIGVEVPNRERDTVPLSSVLTSPAMTRDPHPLLAALGTDIEGQHLAINLAKMPHVLVAGATGSGKSVFVNALLCSLLSRATPEQVRLLLIDPKRVELLAYGQVPHLVMPIVTDPLKAVDALNWVLQEMQSRYDDLASVGARNVEEYNQAVRLARATPHGRDLQPHPYLVVVVDEFADLMMIAGPQVEDTVVRLAQLARAAGIHLVLATQRPSVDVVTGLIKANMPSRLAFATTSATDSRVILDSNGAEKLLGQGDALFLDVSAAAPVRLQGAWVSQAVIDAIVAAAIAAAGASPTWSREPMQASAEPEAKRSGLDLGEEGELLAAAIELVVVSQLGSISMLQRKLRIGFHRAGRLMDVMADLGVVGPPDGPRARAVLIPAGELSALLARLARDQPRTEPGHES